MDERHAAIVGDVVAELGRLGWDVRFEFSFNLGERGSVDVLAWNPARQALLIVEIKSQVVDIQELLSTLDRKRRIVLQIAAAELGWSPAFVGCLVVLPEASRARAAVARDSAVFAAALPTRNVEVRRWLADPTGRLAGLMFLRNSSGRTGKGGSATTPIRSMTLP